MCTNSKFNVCEARRKEEGEKKCENLKRFLIKYQGLTLAKRLTWRFTKKKKIEREI